MAAWVVAVIAIQIVGGCYLIAAVSVNGSRAILASSEKVSVGTVDQILSQELRPVVGAVWRKLHTHAWVEGLTDDFSNDELFQYSTYWLSKDDVTIRFVKGTKETFDVVADLATNTISEVNGTLPRGVTESNLLGPLGIRALQAPSAHEIGLVRVIPDEVGTGSVVQFDYYWPGEAPTSQSSVCDVALTGPAGESLASNIFPLSGPPYDGSRSGIGMTFFSNQAFAEGMTGNVSCTLWDGRGFYAVEAPVVEDIVPGASYSVVTLTALMGWNGPASVIPWNCRATAVDQQSGAEIGGGAIGIMGPARGNWTARPLEFVLEVEGDAQNADYSVECQATTILDPVMN